MITNKMIALLDIMTVLLESVSLIIILVCPSHTFTIDHENTFGAYICAGVHKFTMVIILLKNLPYSELSSYIASTYSLVENLAVLL